MGLSTRGTTMVFAAMLIAGALAVFFAGGCIKEVSGRTYVGEVTSKEYHVWKTAAGPQPSFKFTMSTDEGVKVIDMTCPPVEDYSLEDLKDTVNLYDAPEYRANSEIRIGETLEVTVSERASSVLYMCKEVKYGKPQATAGGQAK